MIDSVLAVSIFGVIGAMIITLIRALRGPTVYDRALAVNSFGTLTVMVLALHGFLTERPEFLDIAILYALINFIGTVAMLRFFSSSGSEAVPQAPTPTIDDAARIPAGEDASRRDKRRRDDRQDIQG
ncbi:monovalent cation/H+ antiporter complex subunit F [Thioalkalivibrio sp. HK1]|uniref:monovalent cation/H+ antiporter complex subunit F n=1 Tax=Thioalkalivibrio sp. HK1 TaxID=1469245 RepID=UPI0004B05CD7|nr:monovalent cation/H+ antiporter complex subunit F [Thioalkalivibrio sp. HK1]